MKKLIIVCVAIMLSFAIITIEKLNVYAKEFAYSNALILENNIGNEDEATQLTFENLSEKSAIVVNTQIIIKNTIINIDNTNNLSHVIDIESKGDLTLDNVTINVNSVSVCVIYNAGKLTLNNCNIVCNKTPVEIINESDVANAILLKNIRENDILSIQLAKGSVFVDNTTKISGKITLSIPEFENATENEKSSDKFVGRALVKSIGSFACRFLDNFALSGCENITDYVGLKDKYYLDYVGVIGDDINVYDDGYSVTYKENGVDVVVDIIESGDIILTKFNMFVKLDNADQQSIADNFAEIGVVTSNYTHIYIGGRYATAQRFLNYISKTGHQNFCVSGNVIGASEYNTKTFALDNCTSLFGHSKNKTFSFRGVVGLGKVGIQTYVDNVLDDSQSTTEYMSAKVEMSADETITEYTSSKLLMLDFDGVTLDKINCNGITGEALDENNNIIYLTASADFLDGKVDIYKKSIKLEPVQKQIYIDNSSFEYSRENKAKDIKPYYLENETPVYLEENEYKFYRLSGEEYILTDNAIDVGKYKIIASSANEDIVFTNELEFEIYPKEITLAFDTDYEYNKSTKVNKFSYVYDGTPKDFAITPVGVIDGDSVEIEKVDNGDIAYTPHIKPGIYSGTFNLKNTQNYVLAENSTKFAVYIDRAHVNEDLIEPEATYKEVEYSGQEYTIGLKNNINGVTFSTSKYTDVGVYTFSIYLYVDTNLYYPISSNKNIISNVTLKIFPKTIYVDSKVVFPTQIEDYRNEKITYIIPDSTLNALNNEIDKNITISQPEIINASDTPYPVSIDIKLKKEFQKNYVLDKTNFESSVIVNKIDVDLSKIIFADQTVVFNGEYQLLPVENSIADIVEEHYTNCGNRDIGDHEQSIRLSLLDTVNYKPLKTETLTATITILPLEVDISKYEFKSATYKYDENTKRKLTIENWEYEKIVIHYSYYLNGKLVANTADGVKDAGNYTVIASFEPVMEFTNNVVPIPEMTATLTILKLQIDFNKITFTDQIFEYDGKEHSLSTLVCPYDISFTYTNNVKTNAGEYVVEANPDIDLNVFECLNYRKITAKLIISKKTVDMSSVTFANITKKYNGRNVEAYVSGKLPSEIEKVTYVNNIQKNVGIYDACACFELKDKDNYAEIPDKTCVITITPVTLTISMPVEKFKYTGSPINVTLSVNGVLAGDSVDVTLKNNGNINVGKYYSQIEISNSNYVCSKTQVSYTIEKAEVDLSGISFEDVDIVYDGKEHVPQLLGTLPSVVTANITVNKAKNVGEYIAYVDFTVTNTNYIKPDRISAKVTITPRPTLVEFSNYYRLVENGERKEIGISFSDVLEENFSDYIVTYSSDPIFAGNYTVTVTFPDSSNYELLGVNCLHFEILQKSKTYVNSGYEIKLESDGFKKDASIELGSVENVTEKLEDLNLSIANYNAFSLNMNNVENRKEVSVSMKTNSLNVNNLKMLRVYRIVGNEIEEVNFECISGELKFVANIGDGIIIVEEKTQITKSMVVIVTLVASSVAIIIGIVIGVCISKKRKKSVNHFLHNDD